MSTNLDKLTNDWANDPQLQDLAFGTVEELAEHLRSAHRDMMNGGLGPVGYLYRQQTLRLQELRNERKQ